MTTEAFAAACLAPFVLPICLYVAFTDLKQMRITNQAVTALVVVFAIGGLILYPFPDYLWRWLHLVVVLVVGIVLNMGGALGAGDAKFMAAAAPFVALADIGLASWLLAGTAVSGFIAHRIARGTRLRELAPGWESWTAGKRFPMGFPLGATLAAYLLITAFRPV
ncbi:prepilin peptidase [Roseisalinus antarcticus]|uniref:Type IV leader peptidase family protein n=1 Tax=Roseisalinus antarcticus TaxID=254357 RepID=A0A1Y5SXE3_9RHOB|nr:prepilin peptidase [Roseisalinus antarcticus]SLN50823.1 Type IV leader peptidase family protein [Roseisalinus antarcticus]